MSEVHCLMSCCILWGSDAIAGTLSSRRLSSSPSSGPLQKHTDALMFQIEHNQQSVKNQRSIQAVMQDVFFVSIKCMCKAFSTPYSKPSRCEQADAIRTYVRSLPSSRSFAKVTAAACAFSNFLHSNIQDTSLNNRAQVHLRAALIARAERPRCCNWLKLQ